MSLLVTCWLCIPVYVAVSHGMNQLLLLAEKIVLILIFVMILKAMLGLPNETQ